MICRKNYIVYFLILFFGVVHSNVIVLNGLTHIHDVENGQKIQGAIELQNTDKENPQRVLIYLKDLLQDCEGKTHYLEINDQERTLCEWVELSHNEKILQPGEKFNLIYTITVPQSSSIKLKDGSFWGVLMVELAKPLAEDNQYGLQIDSKIRYGIQLIANLGEKRTSEIEFLDIKVVTKQEGKFAEILVKNNGDYLVQPTVLLELYSEEGEKVKEYQATFKKVYPSSCKSFLIPVNKVKSGTYQGVIVADYGGELFGVNVSLDILEDN